MSYPKIQLMLDQGRFAEAEAAIRLELTGAMENEFLFNLLAIALLSQNKPKEAEKAARQSIAIEAEGDLAFYMLARCLLAQNKKKEALEAVHEALRIDPEDADYFALKAQIYLDWSKYKQSLEAAESGLEMYPEHDGCRFFRSIALEKLGRKEEAEAETLSLLSDDPDDAENHAVRGWVLAQRGDTEGAERHFIEALRIEPDSPDAKAGLAFVLRLKSPILGGLLRFLMLLERIPFWVFILGIFLTMRFADQLSRSDLPFPIPLLGAAIRVLFWAFFLVCLMIPLLQNMVLSASKTARHVLSEDERRAIKWFAVPLAVALVYLVLWIISGEHRFFPVHAVIWAALARVIFEVFEDSHRWVQRSMAGVAVLVMAVVVWIEYYMYVIFQPQLQALMYEINTATKDLSIPANREEWSDDIKSMMGGFIERMRTLHQNRDKMADYPAIAIWLVAAFADDIAGFFRRKAPD